MIKKAPFPTNEEIFHPSLMFEMKVRLFPSGAAGSPVLPTKMRPGADAVNHYRLTIYRKYHILSSIMHIQV
jgi:hypothetical protein